jgi:hypothetical protein
MRSLRGFSSFTLRGGLNHGVRASLSSFSRRLPRRPLLWASSAVLMCVGVQAANSYVAEEKPEKRSFDDESKEEKDSYNPFNPVLKVFNGIISWYKAKVLHEEQKEPLMCPFAKCFCV